MTTKKWTIREAYWKSRHKIFDVCLG